jgi:simple sugar transport system permease protein
MADAAATLPPKPAPRPTDARRSQSPLRLFYRRNGRALNAFVTLLLVWGFFAANNLELFLIPGYYNAFLFSVPATIIMTTALVFVVVAGEIDLAFPSVMGASGGIFMTLILWGLPIIPAALATLLVGAAIGAAIGTVVVYGRISSLVATLGLNFFIVGIVNLLAQGRNIEDRDSVQTWGFQFFTGRWDLWGLQVPNHFVIAVLWTALLYVVFRYHRFGVRVQLVGDNPESARQMGINIDLVRVGVFVVSGLAAALCGVILVQTANMVWFPTSGKAYLLIALAALFVGGTPVWGGVGTIWGAFFGALTITLIPSGAVGAGFAGFWTDFIFGLVIILTMVAHLFSGARVR